MSFIKSGSIVTGFTLLSRITGLARELFIAYSFGATNLADGVNVAFKLPNLFRRIFGEGALSSVFIPIYNNKLLASEQQAAHFATQIFWLLGLWLSVITLVMELAMPQIMFVLAPGFHLNPEKFATTVFLCRITTPYLIFVCITALFGGILNSHRKFALFAFIPSVLSITIIVVTFLIGDALKKDTSVALSILIAGFIQVITMYIGAKKANASLACNLLFTFDKDVKLFVRNMIPAGATAGVMQINLFISQSIASFLPGAVSILSYADRLYQFPLSLIGIAFGTVLLPELAKLHQAKDFARGATVQNNAIKLGLFLSSAAMIGIYELAQPLVYLIYERGAFTTANRIDTANVLCGFAFGLPAFTLSKIFTPYFYAVGDVKRPMIITIITVILNTVLNVILMQYFGYVGIAISSSIAAWISVMIMYYYAAQQGFKLCPTMLGFLTKTTLCLLAMWLWLKQITSSELFADYYNTQISTFYKITLIGGTVTSAVILCLGCAYLLRLNKTPTL